MKKLFLKTFIYISLACIFAACAQEKKERVLTVSIEPQRFLLEKIVGDKYTVETMLERGTNPETFDPSFAKRLSADRSAAYFGVGTMPFEEILKESLSESTPYVDTSEGIAYIYGTHTLRDFRHNSHQHDKEDLDPHVWTSFANAKIIATNMTSAMKKIDSDNATYYQNNMDRLAGYLDSLEVSVRAKLRNNHKAFAIWHPSLTYFAREFGLQQISVGQESKEMSPKQIREVVELAKANDVHVFFYQKELDSRQAESLNSHIGAELVPIDMLSYDFAKQIMNIANALQK